MPVTDFTSMRDIYNLDDLTGAATALREGMVVDWQPGDGTRYECVSFAIKGVRFFAVLNLGGWTCKVGGPPRGIDTWIALGLPRGSWRGLRPLLHAMGWAQGGRPLNDHDAVEEFEARADTPAKRSRPHEHDEYRHDAAMGRMVRSLLEAEGYAYKLPTDQHASWCGLGPSHEGPCHP
jgi:hypothetical protein